MHLVVAISAQHHQITIVELAFGVAAPRYDVMDVYLAVSLDRFATQLARLASLTNQPRLHLSQLFAVSRLVLLFLFKGAMVGNIQPPIAPPPHPLTLSGGGVGFWIVSIILI